ncbi:MAG: HAD-IIIC family phosphatase [bacterium]
MSADKQINYAELEFAGAIAGVAKFESDPPEGAVPYKIAFLRNITLDPVVPYLEYLCWQSNLKPEIYMSGFDVAMQEAADSRSGLFENNPDLIVVALTLDLLSEPISRRFASLSGVDVAAAADQVAGFMVSVLENIRKKSRAAIIVHSFETPAFPAYGILDFQNAGRQTGTIAGLNARLAEDASRIGNCYILSVDNLIARVGREKFADPRMWHMGKIPYSREAWKAVAAEYAKYIRALRGRNKKCLVLDCDNTLWGGVVGEDGINGIRIGENFPGSCYRDFQLAVLNLYHRGVILAVCSRNNEEDALEVFDKHPDMALRREHFAAMRINWNDKASNIKEIQEELNIGMDSIVFADDSGMEVEMAGRMLPELTTILLPKDASRYAETISNCGFFDALAISDEDRNRGRMYRAESERKQLSASYSDVGEYLRSLDIDIKITRADSFSMPRIAQLMSRTNQFNLAGKRYTETEIAGLASTDGCDVLCLQYSDRFGDMGIVGAAVLIHEPGVATIDSFLLSCRALGRRVEDLLLAECLKISKNKNEVIVKGIYAPSKKNSQTADFYLKAGFVKDFEKDGNVHFVFDTERKNIKTPDVFKTVAVAI